MKSEHVKLQFNSAKSKMDIPTDVWQGSLSLAIEDPDAKIKHSELDGDENNRNHVASIAESVKCHVHFVGDEVYEVVSGEGTLYWGEVQEGIGTVKEENPVAVVTGDSFIIPENYAHQLVKVGDVPLVITFSCPDSHLDNDKDRTFKDSLAP